MDLVKGNGHIPIIGAKRTWKQVRMMPFRQVDPDQRMPPNGQPVKILHPGGLFLTILEAVRSDGEPVVIQVPFEKLEFGDPVTFGNKLASAFQHLHTFLNCGCVKGVQCSMHRTVQQSMDQQAAVPPLSM